MPIERCEFGRIVVDGEVYTVDSILSPDGVEPDWWRTDGHTLTREDVRPLLEKMPSVLIIGTGMDGHLRVSPDMLLYMADHCSEVHVEKTPRAADIYNHALASHHRPVAGMHLTC